MKYYELSYLISPELSEEKTREILENITKTIHNEGGVLEKSILPKIQEIGYRIKKQKQAYFGSMLFRLDPKKIDNLNKKIKSYPQVLRFLLYSKKMTSPKPGRIKPSRLVRKEIAVGVPQVVPQKEKTPTHKKVKKVELEEIDKKLDEILK